MATVDATCEACEDAENPSQASAQTSETNEMLKRLVDLKEKRARMEAERCDLDRKLNESRQEMDEMKRDVEVLNNLDPSQYRHLEQEMRGDHLADRSNFPDAQTQGDANGD